MSATAPAPDAAQPIDRLHVASVREAAGDAHEQLMAACAPLLATDVALWGRITAAAYNLQAAHGHALLVTMGVIK